MPRPPAWENSQAITPARYGVTRVAICSGGVLATARHSEAIFVPTSGSPSTHVGGAGMPRATTIRVQATTSSARSTTATTAMVTGAARTASMSSVITVTARTRLPHRRACTTRSAGQVATTTIVAHTTAGRNGRRIQKLAAIKPPIATTARSMRGRSQGAAGRTTTRRPGPPPAGSRVLAVRDRRRGRDRLGRGGPTPEAHLLHEGEVAGDDEHAEEGGDEHAPEHGGAHDVLGARA